MRTLFSTILIQGDCGTAGRIGQRQYRMAFFGEDEWKVTPALTLNIGLRYGYDQPLYEVNNKEVNVDVKNPQNCPACLLLAGKNGKQCAVQRLPRTVHAPRFVRLPTDPKQVFRGGYAITDDFEGMGRRSASRKPSIHFSYYSQTGSPTATTAGNPIRSARASTQVGPLQSKHVQRLDPTSSPS